METLDSGAYKVISSVNGCYIMILFCVNARSKKQQQT